MSSTLERLSKFRAAIATPTTEPAGVRELALDLIDPDPEQPRKTFDDLDELAESIKTHGVLQPITVVAVGDRYRVAYGERRYRASRIAGRATVPAIVVAAAAEIRERQLIENLYRTDLSALEIAATIRGLLDGPGKPSIAALAASLAKPRPWVSMHAAVSDMAPELVRLLKNGSGIRAVYDLHVAAKKNAAVLTAVAGREVVTAGDVAALLQPPASKSSEPVAGPGPMPAVPATPAAAIEATRPPAVAKPEKDPHTAALERQVEEVLGFKTVISVVGPGERTRVIVEVGDFDQLAQVTGRLMRR